jgi:hypothetical protein
MLAGKGLNWFICIDYNNEYRYMLFLILCDRMYWVHRFSQFLTMMLVWRLIMLRSQTARQLWFMLFSSIFRVAQSLPHLTH